MSAIIAAGFVGVIFALLSISLNTSPHDFPLRVACVVTAFVAAIVCVIGAVVV